MTEEQKEILIAKMIDAPSSLTEAELDLIAHDEELQGIYEMSAEVSGACVKHPEFDMTKEWELFRPRLRRKPSGWRWVMRVASIFLAVIVVSGIAGEVIDRIFSSRQTDQIAGLVEDQKPTSETAASDSEELNSETLSIGSEKLIASSEVNGNSKDETPLISAKSSSLKSRSSSSKSPSAKPSVKDETVEPVKTEEIDIDEYLRVQQARIDNDLALQAAAVYQEEYDNLLPILILSGIDTDDFENEIGIVTAQ